MPLMDDLSYAERIARVAVNCSESSYKAAGFDRSQHNDHVPKYYTADESLIVCSSCSKGSWRVGRKWVVFLAKVGCGLTTFSDPLPTHISEIWKEKIISIDFTYGANLPNRTVVEAVIVLFEHTETNLYRRVIGINRKIRQYTWMHCLWQQC